MGHGQFALLLCVIFFNGVTSQDAITYIFGFDGTTSHGEITLEDTKDGNVTIVGWIQNLGPGIHAIHIHQWGDLSSPSTSGPHYNPTSADQCSGMDGEWGNLINSVGTRIQTIANISQNISSTLSNIIGRSIIVHQGEEPCNVPGSAGTRVAGGVIGSVGSVSGVLNATEIPVCFLGATADSTIQIAGPLKISEEMYNSSSFQISISGNLTDLTGEWSIALLKGGKLDSALDLRSTFTGSAVNVSWNSRESSVGRAIILTPIPSASPSTTPSISPSTTPSKSSSPSPPRNPPGKKSTARKGDPSPSPAAFCIVGRALASPSSSPSPSPSSGVSSSPSSSPSLSPSPSPSPVVSSNSSIAPSGSPDSAVSPSTSPATHNETTTEEPPNRTGMIVGVVFAGLILLGLGFFLYRRSKRNQRQGFTRTIGEF